MSGMSVRGSLRARLLAGSVVWVLGALTVTGCVLGDLFRRHVEDRFQAELRIHLDQLTASIEFAPEEGPRLRTDLSDPRLHKPLSGFYWQVDREGSDSVRGVLRSRSLWDATLAVPSDGPRDGEVHLHRIEGPDREPLVMMERIVRPEEAAGLPLRLIVAADERGMTNPVREFVGLLVTALGVLAAGVIAAVLLQVSVGLAPLKRLRAQLAEVRDGRSRRLQGGFPNEVQPLVDELNAVLQHDAEVVERARTQAGNLAHAIKTPLAVLGNAALREEGPLARLVAEQVATAQRQVDYHLARARAAAATQVPGLRSALRPAVEGLVRVMQRVHAERNLHIAIEAIPDDAAFRGEEQDLQEMLGNLIDNACKWSRTSVGVSATVRAGELVVTVDDDGLGLPPETREAVFARGMRADEAVPGSGLGLGIVRDLAQLYGGRIELGQAPAGGLRATLYLPAA
ncbi:ATP-binding protein [Aromatoleum petrolei]|uniref:histidine kinase n=1 Tax=Aromatoleum petrolei TaxID=76116 RepID=A0ABX1MU31_9RHOO|nr:ATP-binding protein [Aromatoleum petrolei]NMF91492.1 ATP-binding protein [Aromatoleum petrolei]QTQ35593.1 Two component system sensor histidine kinase [Aromatoleum petrolei]